MAGREIPKNHTQYLLDMKNTLPGFSIARWEGKIGFYGPFKIDTSEAGKFIIIGVSGDRISIPLDSPDLANLFSYYLGIQGGLMSHLWRAQLGTMLNSNAIIPDDFIHSTDGFIALPEDIKPMFETYMRELTRLDQNAANGVQIETNRDNDFCRRVKINGADLVWRMVRELDTILLINRVDFPTWKQVRDQAIEWKATIAKHNDDVKAGRAPERVAIPGAISVAALPDLPKAPIAAAPAAGYIHPEIPFESDPFAQGLAQVVRNHLKAEIETLKMMREGAADAQRSLYEYRDHLEDDKKKLEQDIDDHKKRVAADLADIAAQRQELADEKEKLKRKYDEIPDLVQKATADAKRARHKEKIKAIADIISKMPRVQLMREGAQPDIAPRIKKIVSAHLYDTFEQTVEKRVNEVTEIVSEPIAEEVQGRVGCIVCFDTVTDRVLPCGHTICSKCVDKLVKSECPKCREKFDKKNVGKLFHS